jgi:hypothetical protein
MQYTTAVQDRIERLLKIGGEILDKQVTNGNELAAVGVNQGVHFVMYPDGTFERFEKDELVKYRKGWTGPTINDPKEVRARKEREFNEQMAAIAEEKQKQRDARRAARKKGLVESNEPSLVERLKRYEIEVPAAEREVIELARPAFDFFFEQFGQTIDRKISGSTREKENWSDPEYVLDFVTNKLKPYLGTEDATGEVDGEGPACSPEEWQDFKQLDTAYQLTLAVQFCGILPY